MEFATDVRVFLDRLWDDFEAMDRLFAAAIKSPSLSNDDEVGSNVLFDLVDLLDLCFEECEAELVPMDFAPMVLPSESTNVTEGPVQFPPRCRLVREALEVMEAEPDAASCDFIIARKKMKKEKFKTIHCNRQSPLRSQQGLK